MVPYGLNSTNGHIRNVSVVPCATTSSWYSSSPLHRYSPLGEHQTRTESVWDWLCCQGHVWLLSYRRGCRYQPVWPKVHAFPNQSHAQWDHPLSLQKYNTHHRLLSFNYWEPQHMQRPLVMIFATKRWLSLLK